MAEITLLVGLPGSGKTYLARQLISSTHKNYVFVDDPKYFSELEVYLKQGVNILLADPHLCDPKKRAAAINKISAFDYNISFIFFENDQGKCFKNIERRNDGRVIRNLNCFNYGIPEGEKIKKIYT